MDSKQILKVTLILICVVAFQEVGATPATVSPADPVPDHFAYLTLMQELARGEAQEAHTANIRLIEDHMSLDTAHAALFLQFMVSSYDQIVSTNRAMASRVLCDGTVPKFDKRNAHQVLGVLDNIREANLQSSYRRAKANLGAHATRHLNEWLATIKRTDAAGLSDRRGAYLGQDRNISRVIDDACSLAAAG